MADNFDFTEGAGAVGAADDCAGVYYPFVKLVDGTLDSTTVIAAGGGAEAAALRVTIANDSTGVVSIDDNGGAITVDGTVIANLGAIDNAVLDTIDAVLDTINAKLVTGTVIGDVNLGATDNAVLDVIAGDTTSLDGKVTACNTGAVVLATGSAAIGKLAANTGVDIGDVDVTSIIPLTGATNLGKARDVACGANDVGIMALAVRDDTLTTLTPADGDYVPLRVSSTGQLHVTGAGGGTEYTEDVVTANPQVGSAIMVERDDALTTVTPAEADWIGLRGTAEGALWTQDFNSDAILADTTSIDGKITACNTGAVVVSSGTITANLGATDNAVLDAIDTVLDLINAKLVTGTVIGDVNLGATDNAVLDTIETNTDSLVVVGGGAETTALRVTLANDSTGVITVDGTVTANLSATDNAVLDSISSDTASMLPGVQNIDTKITAWDATHALAASTDGPQVMGAGYNIALPTDVGADGDAARICTDRYGRPLAGIMPQNFQATMTSADAQAATPVMTKTASRKMYILSLVVSTDTAMNIQFQDDTGPTVLIEQLYLAANGGAHLTWPPEAPLVVNTNEDFDVIASAAGNISVTITGYLAV